jgi:hypothetical protein
MLMGKVVGPSWKGSQVYISFNFNREFSDPQSTQQWTKPQLFYEKPGYTLWYPSLQPLNTTEDVENKYTCLRLGRKARFFVKSLKPYEDEYSSEYIIEFEKR